MAELIKFIKLTKGQYAIVDEKNFEELSQYRWYYGCRGYAVANIKKEGRWNKIYMHRKILNAPTKSLCDHISRDKLENREFNLRLCTTTENSRNRDIQKSNITGFIGITFHPKTKKWCARITVDKKTIHLGLYADKAAAARAYDAAAKRYHKGFAKTNFGEPQ